MKKFTAAALLFSVLIGLSGCVTTNPDGSRTWSLGNVYRQLTTKNNEVVDVYLATFQPDSWDVWDRIRSAPETRAALVSGKIQVKFLAEGLLLYPSVPTVVGEYKLSLPPALLYEGLLSVNKEMAWSYLDYMSKNRTWFHEEQNIVKLNREDKALHAKADAWMKKNGYSAGVHGLLNTMGERPLRNLVQYWAEFRKAKGVETTKVTPFIAVNGVENPGALNALRSSGIQ